MQRTQGRNIPFGGTPLSDRDVVPAKASVTLHLCRPAHALSLIVGVSGFPARGYFIPGSMGARGGRLFFQPPRILEAEMDPAIAGRKIGREFQKKSR